MSAANSPKATKSTEAPKMSVQEILSPSRATIDAIKKGLHDAAAPTSPRQGCGEKTCDSGACEAKACGTPAKQTASKAEGTPSKAAGTPGRVAGTPGKVAGTPSKAAGTPGKPAAAGN